MFFAFVLLNKERRTLFVALLPASLTYSVICFLNRLTCNKKKENRRRLISYIERKPEQKVEELENGTFKMKTIQTRNRTEAWKGKENCCHHIERHLPKNIFGGEESQTTDFEKTASVESLQIWLTFRKTNDEGNLNGNYRHQNGRIERTLVKSTGMHAHQLRHDAYIKIHEDWWLSVKVFIQNWWSLIRFLRQREEKRYGKKREQMLTSEKQSLLFLRRPHKIPI